jgi:uncharacterized LabA/DUF88 family protein
MNATNERRLALFLDFENLVTNTGLTASNFDLQPALDQLLERGKVIFRRAYCDWSRFREAKAGLHALGVELIDVPPSTSAGKNGADIRLVIDALELSYAREHIDTFVIVSGDSDFCPLAQKLRENDKRVIGMAVREATSPFFVRACDEFLYLPTPGRGGANKSERQRDERPSRAGGGRGRSSRGGGGGGGGSKRGPGVVPQLARDVVSALLARATGPLNPSLIKETMVRREPDFDERAHGFSSLSRLLEAMQTEGLLKLQQRGRQWYVTPADQGDAAAPATREEPEEVFDDEEVIPDPED